MWKRIRDGIGGFLKNEANTHLAGIALWVVFVSEIKPPGTSLLKSSFLVVIGMLAIHYIAKGIGNSNTKTRSEEDRKDRPAPLTVTRPAGRANQAELPKEKH